MEYIMDKDKFDIVSMEEAKVVLSVAVEKWISWERKTLVRQ